MAKVEIKMLGNFEIRVGGRPVLASLGQSRKATALVQYLVLQRGARVPHKTLTDALWGGERCANPDMALRAILHRFRGMVAQEGIPELENCIVTSRGSYQWNPDLPCEVDVFVLQDLADEARKETDPARRLALDEQIVGVYLGRLLPTSAGEPWVESIAVRVHTLYRTAMIHLLEHYKKEGDSERLIALCEGALEKNPRAERLYLELIMALESLGRHGEARQAARRGRNAGCLHQTAEPSRAAPLWRQARQADRKMESEMARLLTALPGESGNELLLCSFENFRQIYRMQRGIQNRYNLPVFLVLLSMVPVKTNDESEREAMMQGLEGLLRARLRGCDVAARYSPTQYALLLCGTPGEDIPVLERIKEEFYALPAQGRYLLNYNIYSPKNGEEPPRRRRGRAAKP